MSYTYHKLAEVDLAILERVSEAEVWGWFVARMAKCRAEGCPVSSFSSYVSVCDGKAMYVSQINIHGAGKVADGCDLAEAERNFRKAIGEFSAKQEAAKKKVEAAKKKVEAARLLREAEELEAMAGKEIAARA